MEKSTIFGIIIGFVAIAVGMILKGAQLSALANSAAFLIIIGGTAASLLNAFPMSDLKKIPTLFKILFTKEELPPKQGIVEQFMRWAQVARREGLLALENNLDEIEDPFLKNGMKLIIDGREMEFVRDILNEEIDAMEERHLAGAQIFTQAGTYAPTLGVLGAVVGLIAALGNLQDSSVLGASIAAAFVATLLGIFTGYVLWHPFANKLKEKSRKEIEIKRMIAEGILSIQAGISSADIADKLMVYIPASERFPGRAQGEARNV